MAKKGSKISAEEYIKILTHDRVMTQALTILGLSKHNILDVLAKRHCYSTLDRNCRLMFRVHGATMGNIISEPVKEVKVSVRVGAPDKGDLIAKIELFEDGEVVDTDEPKQESHFWNPKRTPKPGKHYYFVKVT